jgi:hypothetical protein
VIILFFSPLGGGQAVWQHIPGTVRERERERERERDGCKDATAQHGESLEEKENRRLQDYVISEER